MGRARLMSTGRMPVWSSVWVVGLVILYELLQVQLLMVQAQDLQVGFYEQICPNAEAIVRSGVQQGLGQDLGNAPGLLRLHFHDCFVEGCDASVLLDGPNSEKTAGPNFSLRGFEVVDAVKAALESQCPGVVSCADILAFAARDAVELTGGQHYDVPAGRFDGKVSVAAEASAALPTPGMNVDQLNAAFGNKGLSQSDMLILSGAHTFGRVHCSTVISRLYPTQDPNLDVTLAEQLKLTCPQQGGSPASTFNLDNTTPDLFDNMYYSNLRDGKGVLASDQVLYESFSTRAATIFNSLASGSFLSDFSESMVTMGGIELKTNATGEIRRNCRVVNSQV